MNRPLTPSEECALTFPPRTFEYMRCLETKISNPHTIGYEMTPKMDIKTIIIIILIIYIIICIMTNTNPFDVIFSFL